MSDAAFAALAILVGWLATDGWRVLGVVLSGRLDPNSRLFDWVACVAYALLAGLITRMILLPVGPLAETADWQRLGATAGALLVFFLAGRRILLSVAAGAGLLALLNWLGSISG